VTVIEGKFSLEERTEFYRKQMFARNYAGGMTLNRSLQKAGYTGRSESFALSLLMDGSVIEEMEKVFETLRKNIGMSKEAIIAQLDTDRDFAYEQESPAAAINATVAKARILGFLDKAETNRLPPNLGIGWSEDSTEVKHSSFKPEEKRAD